MLTALQREAVSHPGNLLLTACPGSGKTRTLIAKLVTEIEHVRGSPRQIGCITYTNSAVQEIEQRAREQLLPGDDLYFRVSTIHSFCLTEVLRPYGWLIPEYAKHRSILTRENPDFELICRHAAAQVNYLNLSRYDFDAFEGLSVDPAGNLMGLATRNTPVSNAAPHFWARCAAMGYIDFGTIIYGAYRILRDHPKVAKSLSSRFLWILVDEFQDTTELQIEILKLIYAAGRSHFFAVGDLSQSIFSFTGAKPELVAPFGVHIRARQNLSLWQNYRSSKKIVGHAERLIPRIPPMEAVGSTADFSAEPLLVQGVTNFQAITEVYLPTIDALGISLGGATVLAKDHATLIALSRQLRDFGTPVVGPGARPYRRSRLFAQLAEQLCGAIIEPHSDTTHQLERALYHTIQDATAETPAGIFSYNGRLVIVRLLRQARELATTHTGAIAWLDAMSATTARILYEAELIDRTQSGLFYASVQEMKADMARQNIDMANMGLEDLGLFASPTKALRLSTIHYAKGREYEAVAILGLRQGSFPHRNADDIPAEKRLFYVGITRARKLLMYVSDVDYYRSPPSPFLGADGLNIL